MSSSRTALKAILVLLALAASIALWLALGGGPDPASPESGAVAPVEHEQRRERLDDAGPLQPGWKESREEVQVEASDRREGSDNQITEEKAMEIVRKYMAEETGSDKDIVGYRASQDRYGSWLVGLTLQQRDGAGTYRSSYVVSGDGSKVRRIPYR